MSFDYSTLITNRTQADVTNNTPKGNYGAPDLNRVAACMEDLDEKLARLGYITGFKKIKVPHEEGAHYILKHIEIANLPSKLFYGFGETLDFEGLKVIAYFDQEFQTEVMDYTVSPRTATTSGFQTVTVSYTDEGITKTATFDVEVGRGILYTVPAQNGALVYTGGSLSPAWSNYDSEQLILGGTTSAVDAGTYTATFTPTANYMWSDGSTGAKAVEWSIGKANGALSISPTSLQLKLSDGASNISVTRSGNGTISAESSNPAVATVSVSGTIVVVTPIAAGTAVITVRVGEGTNYLAPTYETAAVEVTSLSSVFSENEWADIIEACRSQSVPASWIVGDEKPMTVGGVSYVIRIAGKTHDDYADGSGKAPITFEFAQCYNTMYAYNGSNTNVGGWSACNIKKTAMPQIFANLPAEVQAAIRPVLKKHSAGNTSYTILTTEETLFPASEVEIFGYTTYSAPGEGEQYEYYKNTGNYKKTINGGSARVASRSPRVGDNWRWCVVETSGIPEFYPATNSMGVSPLFCF